MDDLAQPFEVGRQVRCRPGLIVDVGALVVVQLHGDHEVGDRRELLEHAYEPALRVLEVRRVVHPLGGRVVGVRILQSRRWRITALEEVVQRHAVLRPREQPGGITAVAPLVADHGSRPQDDLECVAPCELHHRVQIAARRCLAREVEVAVCELVPVPWDVQVERVDAQAAVGAQRRLPQRLRQALVEEGPAEHEEGLAVDREDRPAFPLHDRARSPRRRRTARERRQCRERDRDRREERPHPTAAGSRAKGQSRCSRARTR